MLIFPDIGYPSYGFSEDYADNTITSKSDGGYKSTRPRNTRDIGIWDVPYKALKDDKYLLLMDFYRNKASKCAGEFQWTHPQFHTVHTVRFTKKPPFVLTEYGWDGQYTVEEV